MLKALSLCLALLVALCGEASAHAMLRAARPGVGSTVATAPTSIEIDFSEAVVPSFSRVTLQDAAGHAVRLGKPTKSEGGKTLVTPIVGTLGPGVYKVIWHAVSVDTHRTQGSFSFTVGR